MVQASVTYTIGANIETLFLTGTAAINGTGNAAGQRHLRKQCSECLEWRRGQRHSERRYGRGFDERRSRKRHLLRRRRQLTLLPNSRAKARIPCIRPITWILARNFENLSLSGTAATNGTGNAFNNSLDW